MSHETFMEWVGLIVLVALIGLPWWWISRRRARRGLSDEIMSRTCDEEALARAIADSGGDRQQARKRYINARLRHLGRDSRRSVARQMFELLCALWFVGVVASVAYQAYTGDLFWWWDGGAVSRETVIGLLWVVTLVLVPYFTYSLAARRRVSRARATGAVLGATVAAFVCLFVFSTAIAKMLV